MPKISINLTLVWFVIMIIAIPYTAFAKDKNVACETDLECYQQVLEKLEQMQELMKAQQVENNQLTAKIKRLVAKNRRLLLSTGWKLLYEHDFLGKRVQGNLESLKEAIRQGADIKVYFPGRTETSFICEWAYIKKEVVACMNTSNISFRDLVGEDFKFQDNAYHWFLMVNTEGKRDMSRWSVGEHVERGHTQDTMGMRWFARLR